MDDSKIIKDYGYVPEANTCCLSPKLLKALAASSDELELNHFVVVEGLPIIRLERPYFVTPNGKKDVEIYQVLAEALRASGKAGIGQIALRGREQLCAVIPFEDGLLFESLCYDIELQDPTDIYGRSARKPKGEYLTLAKHLIDENSGAANFARYHDHYHEALKQVIDAKCHHRKPASRGAAKKPAKVVNFMDALTRSPKEGKRSPAKSTAKTAMQHRAGKKASHRHAA